MKKVTKLLAVVLMFVSAQSFAQVKLAHVNMQELVALMPESDSANVKLEKYGKELSDQMQDMQKELQGKYETYQQKSGTWTAAVLESKQKELQDMQGRLEQFQQNAQADYQQMNQKLYAPIVKKANDAITKIGKDNSYTYIFDISAGSLIYVSETLSTDIMPMAKKALGIPADKKLKALNAQQTQKSGK